MIVDRALDNLRGRDGEVQGQVIKGEELISGAAS
jgi:hypothetical protein